MRRNCAVCETPTRKTCTGCARIAYCSPECQTKGWLSHRLACDRPGREITTADRLACVVTKVSDGELMMDTQTMFDYGIDRVAGERDVFSLLRIYTELLQELGVKPSSLHTWRIEGRLYREMLATYRAAGNRASKVNFAWLCRHEHVFDPNYDPSHFYDVQEDEWHMRGWRAIGGSASFRWSDVREIVASWPEYKQICLNFYNTVLAVGGPAIQAFGPWLQFGFCAFEDTASEPVQDLYACLIVLCTFDEFCEAYRTSALIPLMDRKGLKEMRLSMPQAHEFEVVLSESPNNISTIWWLKSYALLTKSNLHLTVLIPYGFGNCRDRAEFRQLMQFYNRHFREGKVPPFELQKAAENDRIYDYISKHPSVKIANSEKRFLSRVLQTHNREIFGGSSVSTKAQWHQLDKMVLVLTIYLTSPMYKWSQAQRS
ncbi:hypothetical protein SISSUDRAFT_1130423 [Sistotremastrum suecicum HHB10207 ss-3]|uniref:MYND-type domain-containing protein n=1 Tax=Sistotremastrum suecicum HHB10207 ss-3 TaxID=1314776 RepID=A0A166BFQ8_9AGAM|nr:hypothetical protein SISSUDRAFT_1130423 [Sistotremastrum suecicum HHB10207 ss-3]